MEKKHGTIFGDLIDDLHKNHSEYKNHKRDYLPYLRRISYINHKETRVIPDIIHFIWIGKWDKRNEEYINIWRMENPYKKIFIWVEEDSNIWLNKDNFSTENDGNKLTKTNEIDFTDQNLIRNNIYIHNINSIFYGYFKKYKILLYYEVMIRRNFACASDIVRLIVLYLYGGIYIDVDTLPAMKDNFKSTNQYLHKNNLIKNECVCVAKTSAMLMKNKEGKINYTFLYELIIRNSELDHFIVNNIVTLMIDDMSLCDKVALNSIGDISVHKDFIKLSTLDFLDGVFFNNIICANPGSRFIRIVLRKIFSDYIKIVKNGYLTGERCPDFDGFNLNYQEVLSYYHRDRINEKESVTNYLTGPNKIVSTLLFIIRRVLKLSHRIPNIFILRLMQNNIHGLGFSNQTLDTPNGIKYNRNSNKRESDESKRTNTYM